MKFENNIKSKQPRIAIIYPKFGWGGSEAVVLHAIAALKDEYNISLITSGKLDISGLNKYYNTNLSPENFSLIRVKMPFGIEKIAKFAALRGRFIQRYCQRASSEFDVMFNAYNPCDFKTTGIQYVADIAELPEIISLPNFKKLWYDDTFLRKLYLKLCDLVSPNNPKGWKKNLTLSNSDWTADLMLKKYGIKAKTLYPPVAAEFSNIPFRERDNGFICLGRIVPEKKIDMAIEILERVRQKDYNIHLHIIGGEEDKYYARTLRGFYSKRKDWLFFEGRLSEERKKNLISSHKFGISCRKNEPFGIAVAEMVKAGCIVFVPDGGGQTEIVSNPVLIYKNIEDAASKIEKVLKDDVLQSELLKNLSLQSEKFSIEQFKTKIKKIVSDFLNNNE